MSRHRAHATVEQILVRIDDKLSRLSRGSGTETEDVEQDLILVLLRIARRRSAGLPNMRPMPGVAFDPLSNPDLR